MSETITLPAPTEAIPNAPSVDPPAPAPAPTPAAIDPPEPAEQTEEERTRARDDESRRVAQVRARLGATERERDQLAARLAYYEARDVPLPGTPLTPEQQEAALRQQIRAEEAGKIRAERFHEEGSAAFPDWGKRCADLMAMGADTGFAQLLVEMPGGTKVAAALSDDPAEVERISAIRTERGRAIALGRYAATLDAQGGVTGATPRTQSQPVTRAPAPVRPVTGRASPQFNEYTASAQDLVEHYLKPTPIRR
jgi:hypothetical protein